MLTGRGDAIDRIVGLELGADDIGLGLGFIAFLLKSAAEERFMREEFSGEYARYSQRVRRLIPFIF
jgi:hypothetical protein